MSQILNVLVQTQGKEDIVAMLLSQGPRKRDPFVKEKKSSDTDGKFLRLSECKVVIIDLCEIHRLINRILIQYLSS